MRCSYRLQSKRRRPCFKPPTREQIWKHITTDKSPEKLNRIRPRKSISNFTKVYSSYNFDDYEDTGDEESGSCSSSGSSSDDETPRRVKNYRKRIVVASSSSDEDSSVLNGNIKTHQLHNVVNQDTSVDENNQKDKCDKKESSSNTAAEGNTSENIIVPLGANDSNCDIQKPDNVSLSQNFDLSHSDDSDDCIVVSQRLNSSSHAQRSILKSDDESDGEKSISPDETDLTNQRHQRTSSLKEKQKSLFLGFKDALAKKKLRSSNSESK